MIFKLIEILTWSSLLGLQFQSVSAHGAVLYSDTEVRGAVFHFVCQNRTPRHVPHCQNKTPRQVPTHSGIGALLGTEKYVFIISGKYDFKTDRNINLVLPSADTLWNCSPNREEIARCFIL